MSENNGRGAGVFANEIDVSQPGGITPSGVPAAIIGTSRTGPAFVPITVPSINEFTARFGDIDSTKFGAMALREWLANRSAGTFVRVLGAGDGKKKSTTTTDADPNAGKTTRAGWVVGQQLVQQNGNLGDNQYIQTVGHAGQFTLGRTYMLGCFMSESSTSTNKLFTGAGIGANASANFSTKPILRGIVMAPSGVTLTLSGCDYADNTPDTGSPTALAGGTLGDVAKTDPNDAAMAPVDNFVMLLNNFKPNGSYNSIITASFDPLSDGYFTSRLNTDPTKIEQAGHLLYSHFNVYTSQAAVTGGMSRLNYTGSAEAVIASTGKGWNVAFLLTSSEARNSGSAQDLTRTNDSGIVGSAGRPNFEGFEDKFKHAQGPWVISQDFGEGPLNLFKFHTLADGSGFDPYNDVAKDDLLPNQVKVSIQNIKAVELKNRTPGNEYGSFDVLVRKINDNDKDFSAFEKFSNVSIDPTSDRFIGRVIGDMNVFYDFEKATRAQKIAVTGRYPNRSQYIRVEIADSVQKGRTSMDPSALPLGFRGPNHLVTSGSGILAPVADIGNGHASSDIHRFSGATLALRRDAMQEVVQPPVPFRDHIGVGLPDTINFNPDFDFYWGVQFTRKAILNQPNADRRFEDSIYSLTKYYPNYQTNLLNVVVGNNPGATDIGGTILDCDRFDNNRFTLERVQVVTQSESGALDIPDMNEAQAFRYRRNGVLADLTLRNSSKQTGRMLNVDKDFVPGANATKLLKFSFFLQGGFNGTNLFNTEKSNLSDVAARREYDDSSNQGGINGPTVVAYRKATDILAEHANVDIQLLAIPGLRLPAITDYAIDAMEDRFDALYVMDIEEKDTNNSFVTGSASLLDVGFTTQRFGDRGLDSSFAAAYFPDVFMTDTTTGLQSKVPATVAAMATFGLNDTLGYPWFAPAGFSRGVVRNALRAAVALTSTDNNDLAANDINPIIDVKAQGTVVYGQRTLFKAQSALDRINVRRLLIDVRRRVKKVANTMLFEPNRAETLARFSAAVNPILRTIQQQQGVDRFRVQIDSSTTTQADVENNTIRGKIFLQPTKSVDFIELDFVVSNTLDTRA